MTFNTIYNSQNTLYKKYGSAFINFNMAHFLICSMCKKAQSILMNALR